jgi:dihydrofolate reductase
MNIHLIWAQARDAQGRAVVGKDGGMPWHLPEDLAFFKRSTGSDPVIMGRRTWESLPAKFRPLPGRLNGVVTRSAGAAFDAQHRCLSALSLQTALQMVEKTKPQRAWVIGGTQMWEAALALPQCTQVLITQIDAVIEGDTFAPHLPEDFKLTQTALPTSKGDLNFRWETWRRN